MIDVQFLLAPLAPPVELDAQELDVKLDRIISLADRSQYIEAGEAAVQLWSSKVYDIRSLGVLLYAVFVDQGMAGLGNLLSAATEVVQTHWKLIGPQINKERHLDGTLRWLVSSITNHFRFSQKLNPTEWQKLLKDWELADQPQVFGAIQGLLSALETMKSSAKKNVVPLVKVLRDLPTTHMHPRPHLSGGGQNPVSGKVGSAASSETENTKSEPGNMKVQEQNTDSIGQPTQTATTTSATISGPQGQPTLVIPLSPPMFALIKKLGAFNRLVRLGRFRQAAIVYKDIKGTIEQFDPRLFLPSVFGEYFSNIVAHADNLLPTMDAKDDFAQRALVDLYRIDLELFIEATC